VEIRAATSEDLTAVLGVQRQAFGSDEEAELVRALLVDPTARPLISLVAVEGGRAIGHILCTKATLAGGEPDPGCLILAPLAVVPTHQGQGVGVALIRAALDVARERGVGLVFVLGHPGYYPRGGFEPAGRLGFAAPYPIPDEVADAWMVQSLGRAHAGGGQVVCAEALDRPELWRE